MSQQCSLALTGITISYVTRESCAVPTFSATKGQCERGAERYRKHQLCHRRSHSGDTLGAGWDWARSHNKVGKSGLKQPEFTSIAFIFTSGCWEGDLGSYQCFKLLLDSHWLNKQIGFKDRALFSKLNNKMDISGQHKCSLASDSAVALLTVLFLDPCFWCAPVSRASTWADPQGQQHVLGSGRAQRLKRTLEYHFEHIGK